MTPLPIVAVSACLLGHAVRYDGKDKYTGLIAEELNKHCCLLAICPEVEIGLGVPRDKIQLTQLGDDIRVLKINDLSVDLTDSLAGFARQFMNQYSLAGLVLQDKSPSCGLGGTKLFSMAGEQVGLGSGVFAATIRQHLPDLPIVLASQLKSLSDVLEFVERIVERSVNE